MPDNHMTPPVCPSNKYRRARNMLALFRALYIITGKLLQYTYISSAPKVASKILMCPPQPAVRIFQKFISTMYVLRRLTNESLLYEKAMWESWLVVEETIYFHCRAKEGTTSSLCLRTTKWLIENFDVLVLLFGFPLQKATKIMPCLPPSLLRHCLT